MLNYSRGYDRGCETPGVFLRFRIQVSVYSINGPTPSSPTTVYVYSSRKYQKSTISQQQFFSAVCTTKTTYLFVYEPRFRYGSAVKGLGPYFIMLYYAYVLTCCFQIFRNYFHRWSSRKPIFDPGEINTVSDQQQY